MPVQKKQKVEPKKQLVINLISGGSPATWRNPNDNTRDFTNGIDAWVTLAQKAERGKLHAIFIADHLTFFDAYDGPNNFKHPLRTGLFSPRASPSEAVGAMAVNTKNIGFGITFSTVSEHPYHFARRIATLDHITNGRIGWNIVSSYLESIGRQLLNGEPLPEHDERYVKSEEYLQVVYELLLSSWRDDAIVYNKKTGVFADPERVREINYNGKYYKVPGPAITEPSPQRFPLVIQAGTSAKGKEFAAKNAEAIFVDGRNLNNLKKDIADIRDLAKKYGRDPKSIKFIAGATPIVAKTHEEALAKAENNKQYLHPDAAAVAFGGISGYDLSKYGLDDEIDVLPNLTNGIQAIVKNVFDKKKGKRPTKREILENYRNKVGSLVGTPEEVANEIERWVEDYDVDGFNFGVAVFPSSIDDIVDLLIPELQKRGVFHKDYIENGTFRENVYGIKGQKFLPEDHPAYKLRWKEGVPKEEFESSLLN